MTDYLNISQKRQNKGENSRFFNVKIHKFALERVNFPLNLNLRRSMQKLLLWGVG